MYQGNNNGLLIRLPDKRWFSVDRPHCSQADAPRHANTGDFQISWPMSTFQKIVPINTLFMHFCLFHINIFCLTLYQRQKIKSQTNAPKVYVPSCVLTYKHMCTHTPQNLACERYWVKWSKSKGLNPQFNYFFSWHMWK